MAVVAADVGGSKTLLGWYPTPDAAGMSAHFDNAGYNEPELILQAFLAAHTDIEPASTTLVLAVAGPVKDHRFCQMTNLQWSFDAARIMQRFGFANVILLNDLEATALAMPHSQMAPHLQSLNGKQVDFHFPVTIISVGTGLGQALLLPNGNGNFRAVTAEGGHKSFAPFDATSAALAQRAYASGLSSLGWEDWISGAGLPHLYRAMFPSDVNLSSAEISRQAQSSPLSPAAQCLEFFTRALFAEAGNLALQYWSEGGVLIAGGVAQHLADWLRQPALQAALSQKPRHQEWLATRPLMLCTNAHAALLGAAAYGWRLQG